jgi:hypothetical protein
MIEIVLVNPLLESVGGGEETFAELAGTVPVAYFGCCEGFPTKNRQHPRLRVSADSASGR